MSESKRIITSGKLIAALTLLSRLFGLMRDAALAATFGTREVADAFWFAFQIPNLFRRLFGEGAMSSAFIPVFTKYLREESRNKATDLFAAVLGLLLAILLTLLLIGELIIFLLYLTQHGDQQSQLMLTLTAIMLPFMVTICILALISGVLNCLNRFALSALTPILLSLSMVAASVMIGPAISANRTVQSYVVATGVTLAGMIQLAVLVPALRRRGILPYPKWNPRHPGVREIGKTMLPIVLALGALQVSTFLDSLLAWLLSARENGPSNFSLFGSVINYPLSSGALASLNFAQRIYQFPLGVLAISLATAAFPVFSRVAASGDRPALMEIVNQTSRLCLFESIPSGIGLMVMAGPIIALLLERGAFAAVDTSNTAHILRFYGAGIWAFSLMQIVIRVFYSLQDTWTPLKVQVSLLCINFVLNCSLIWIPGLGAGVFGLTSALTSTAGLLILLGILRRRLGAALHIKQLITSVLRVAAAAAMMALVVTLVMGWMPQQSTFLNKLLGVMIPMAAGVVTYGAAAAILRCPELRELLGRGWSRR